MERTKWGLADILDALYAWDTKLNRASWRGWVNYIDFENLRKNVKDPINELLRRRD